MYTLQYLNIVTMEVLWKSYKRFKWNNLSYKYIYQRTGYFLQKSGLTDKILKIYDYENPRKRNPVQSLQWRRDESRRIDRAD
jgi:hypothetical protein